MSVKYRKVKNTRTGSSTQGKIYGRAVVNDVIHTKKLAEKISNRCTVTEPDILAVINALETEIADNLAQGNRVVLDGFGSFKVGLSTSPADTAKKFTANNIKGMHVVFAPAIEVESGKRIKSMLRGVKAEEMTEYNGINDENDKTNDVDPGDNPGSDDNPDSGSNPGSDDNPGSGSNPGDTDPDVSGGGSSSSGDTVL